MPTPEQNLTIAALAAIAQDEGGRIVVSNDDPELPLYVTMVAPVSQDSERTTWRVSDDGAAHIL